MLQYPITLERDTNDTILVSFPDIPETHTFGDDEDEAVVRAVEAIEAALSMYIEDRRDIPAPSKVRRGGKSVTLPALTEAKLELYQAMKTDGVGKAELARRLNVHLPQVDRLLDLPHASRLDQLEAAFRALNRKLSVSVEAA